MNPDWFSTLERHVTFGAIVTLWGLMVSFVVWLFNKHKILLRLKDRLNDLWWDRCGFRQDRYTPLENGSPAVIPPRPDYLDQHQHGD